MANSGVYPLDPSTPVGQFRLTYGDTESVPFDPVIPGFQDYTELSDAEIEVFLAQGGGSVTRAIGRYYMRLSGDAAKRSKSVKDYDLSLDLSKRAGDLRETARMYFDEADAEDAGSEDAFVIVPTGLRHGRSAELAEGGWW